jgi:hypothetical protein
VLSGECRIEAIPVRGKAVLIDGLRLRLDLLLAPAATPPDTARRSSALLPRRVQRLAALAGAAALLSALALWFASAPVAPPERSTVAPARAVARAPIPAPPPQLAPVPQLAAPPQLVPVAPEVRPIPPPRPRLEPPPAAPNEPAAPVAKSLTPSRASAPKPAAQRPPATEREMLDLFGDTK